VKSEKKALAPEIEETIKARRKGRRRHGSELCGEFSGKGVFKKKPSHSKKEANGTVWELGKEGT